MNLTYPRQWLKIANRALNLIGSESLQDLDDGSQAAQNIEVQLPAAVQEVMAYHTFWCARKRMTLAPLADAPAFGYKFAYALPADFCSLVEVHSGDMKLKGEEYSREGNTILSDVESMGIVYTALPETPEALVPAVQGAIVHLLAYKLAQITTANDALTARLFQEYQTSLVEAVKRDGQGRGDTDGERPWTEGR